MPAKDLGNKHVCFKCGTRFYDLKKPEPLCPKCGADQRQSPAVKAPEKRPRSAPRPAPVPEPEVVPEAEAEDVEGDDEDDEDDDEDDDE